MTTLKWKKQICVSFVAFPLVLLSCSTETQQTDDQSAAVKEFTADRDSAALLQTRVRAAVKTCLRKEGFSYEVPLVPKSPDLGSGRSFGYFYTMTTERQRQYGYGITFNLVRSALEQSLVAQSLMSQPEGFSETLAKCEDQERRAVRKAAGYMSDSYTAGQIVNRHIELARANFESRPQVQAALKAWSECVARSGFKANRPPDFQRLVDEEINSQIGAVVLPESGPIDSRFARAMEESGVQKLLAREILYAKTQSECTQSSGLSKHEAEFEGILDDQYSRQVQVSNTTATKDEH